MTDDAGTDPRTEALLEAALAAHGGRLDEQQRLAVRQHVERLRATAGALDGFPLTNAAEPDFAFRVVTEIDGA